MTRFRIVPLMVVGLLFALSCSDDEVAEESETHILPGDSDAAGGVHPGDAGQSPEAESLPDAALQDTGLLPDAPLFLDTGVGDGNFPTGCVNVSVEVLFYDNTCYGSWAECGDGPEQVASAGGFCDLENITCDEPDRVHHELSFPPHPGPCRFCSNVDFDDIRCTDIPSVCGDYAIEHIASGSPEAGTHPFVEGCDGG